MEPTLELYERTESPLHRAILLNDGRHVHLEGAAMFEDRSTPWPPSGFAIFTGNASPR